MDLDIFKIDIYYFLISFFIGMFFVYITAPTPEIIIKNPTLENAGKITYIDDNNVCYRYKKEDVTSIIKKNNRI